MDPEIRHGSSERDAFDVVEDDFDSLEVRPSEADGSFCFFYDKKKRSLVRRFVLEKTPHRTLYCNVTLIRKGDRLSPRFEFSKRKTGSDAIVKESSADAVVTARVDLNDCRDDFWKLITFIGSISEIETPAEGFSVVARDEAELVADIRKRDPESIKSIVRGLAKSDGVVLSQADINQMLDRKGKLKEFEVALQEHRNDEPWWQRFFNENKWIFGYGLNYQVLGIEEDQPHYGGTRVDGKGARRGDYLTKTKGDIGFIVLVEIKTPGARLLTGSEEIRSGSWSLSKDLTDALSQLQGNAETWELEGSELPENRDRFESEGVYTIRPRGILVIGRLEEVEGVRSMRATFQRFRSSIHGYDVLTFDEVLARARFIVEREEDKPDPARRSPGR